MNCPLRLCDGSGWLPALDRAGNEASKPCACRLPVPVPAVRKSAAPLRQFDVSARITGDRE